MRKKIKFKKKNKKKQAYVGWFSNKAKLRKMRKRTIECIFADEKFFSCLHCYENVMIFLRINRKEERKI